MAKIKKGYGEMKKVLVEIESGKTLTFETDLPVKIGDRVSLPTPQWLRDVKGNSYEGKVVSLQSDYEGYCVKILRILF